MAGGAAVHVVSAKTGEGLDGLAELPRRRAGRSPSWGRRASASRPCSTPWPGGPSSRPAAIREDDARGRHTTTRRHLVQLANGALILDTPGMRELGLVETDADLDATFADVDELAADCRFGDCRHEREPGCAVRAAIDDGRLDAGRLAGRRKLDRELARVDRERDPRLAGRGAPTLAAHPPGGRPPHEAEVRGGRTMSAEHGRARTSRPRWTGRRPIPGLRFRALCAARPTCPAWSRR